MPALPPTLPTRGAILSTCLSLGVAPPQSTPSPGPSCWQALPASPPRHPDLKTARATPARPPPAQAPRKALPCWPLRASSPPPHPPLPSVAPLRTPLPPQADPAAPTAHAEIRGPQLTYSVINGECICLTLPGNWLPHIPVPPPAPTVEAWPHPLTMWAWLKDEGTGTGDHLYWASLGLGFHLWDCGQVKRAG